MASSSSSFIAVDADSDFPLQNIPFGVFSTATNVSQGQKSRASSNRRTKRKTRWRQQYENSGSELGVVVDYSRENNVSFVRLVKATAAVPELKLQDQIDRYTVLDIVHL